MVDPCQACKNLPGDHPDWMKGMCENCYDDWSDSLNNKKKSNDRAFSTGWSIIKAGKSCDCDVEPVVRDIEYVDPEEKTIRYIEYVCPKCERGWHDDSQ